jgi:hypothetical protein
VQRVKRVENDRGRTGTGQGSGNFSPNVAGFPDPENDHLAASFDRLFNQIDGTGEALAQPAAEPLEFGNFQIEHTNSLFNVFHRYIIVG